MASRLNPYISFDGNAREAMEFYREVFGGTLDVRTFGEFGMADSPLADKIMHSQLETPNGFTLMASDSPPEVGYHPGTNITVSLSGDDAELRDFFQKLADGGNVTQPLEKQAWGDEFGSLTDKFGINWMVNVGTGQA